MFAEFSVTLTTSFLAAPPPFVPFEHYRFFDVVRFFLDLKLVPYSLLLAASSTFVGLFVLTGAAELLLVTFLQSGYDGFEGDDLLLLCTF